MSQQNKNALILGASKGIGLAAAKRMYEEGTTVFINSRNLDNLKLASEYILEASGTTRGNIHLIPFDINIKKEVELSLDKIIKNCKGRMDILVTNTISGRSSQRSFLELSDRDWDLTFVYKFKSIVRVIRKILSLMLKNEYGQIVNIGSIDSKEPQFGYSPSVTMRLSMTAYLKSLSDKVASKGIRINQLLCGYTATETLISYLEAKGKLQGMPGKQLQESIAKKIPLGRLAHPDEIGDVIDFLVSDDASYITGQSIVADGGLLRSAL